MIWPFKRKKRNGIVLAILLQDCVIFAILFLLNILRKKIGLNIGKNTMSEIQKIREKTLRKVLRIIEYRAAKGESCYLAEISDWVCEELKKKGFFIENGYGTYKKVIW